MSRFHPSPLTGEPQYSSFLQPAIQCTISTVFPYQWSNTDFSLLGKFWDCTGVWKCQLSEHHWPHVVKKDTTLSSRYFSFCERFLTKLPGYCDMGQRANDWRYHWCWPGKFLQEASNRPRAVYMPYWCFGNRRCWQYEQVYSTHKLKVLHNSWIPQTEQHVPKGQKLAVLSGVCYLLLDVTSSNPLLHPLSPPPIPLYVVQVQRFGC